MSMRTSSRRKTADHGDFPRPSEFFDLTDHLPYRLSMLSHLVHRTTTERYLRRVGLNYREWQVLGIIGLRGPLTPAVAADLTSLDRATVTRSVDALVEQGLLQRGLDPHDGRRKVLYLTVEGARKCDMIIPMMRDGARIYEAVLTDEELAQVFAILEKLDGQAKRLVEGERPKGQASRSGKEV